MEKCTRALLSRGKRDINEVSASVQKQLNNTSAEPLGCHSLREIYLEVSIKEEADWVDRHKPDLAAGTALFNV